MEAYKSSPESTAQPQAIANHPSTEPDSKLFPTNTNFTAEPVNEPAIRINVNPVGVEDIDELQSISVDPNSALVPLTAHSSAITSPPSTIFDKNGYSGQCLSSLSAFNTSLPRFVHNSNKTSLHNMISGPASISLGEPAALYTLKETLEKDNAIRARELEETFKAQNPRMVTTIDSDRNVSSLLRSFTTCLNRNQALDKASAFVIGVRNFSLAILKQPFWLFHRSTPSIKRRVLFHCVRHAQASLLTKYCCQMM